MAELVLPRSPLHGVAAAAAAPELSLRERRSGTILHLEGPRQSEALAHLLRALDLPALPGPGQSGGNAMARLLRIGPEQWLLVTHQAASMPPDLPWPTAFEAVLEVSHGWTRFTISGRRAGDLLAKGCTLDLDARAFPAGACAATGLAQLRTILWRSPNGAAFDLFVGRSQALWLWEWLVDAAGEFGLAPPDHAVRHQRREG